VVQTIRFPAERVCVRDEDFEVVVSDALLAAVRSNAMESWEIVDRGWMRVNDVVSSRSETLECVGDSDGMRECFVGASASSD
jgi:hypothetical protein